jgi:hypothetical protein
MATKYPVELQGVKDGTVPKLQADGAVVGGGLHRFRSTIELAAAGNGLVQAADAVLLGDLPAGAAFAYGVLTVSASLGAANVAIGTNATHASNGQYRGAAVATTTETPALFGKTAAQKAAPSKTPAKMYLTTDANLPTAGTIVVDIFVSSAR